MDINSRIKDYLSTNKISQSDLANKLGLSNTSLSRSLNSDDLKVSLLIKICGELKVSAATFFDGSEKYSNEEIESYKKRIKELELLININRRAEIERYYNALQQILKEEFPTIDEEMKKKVYQEVSATVNTFDVFEEMSNKIILQISELSKIDIKNHIEETIVKIRARKINAIKESKKK